jgi:molybdopterin-guanine dinucleotide biosynthesis protein A
MSRAERLEAAKKLSLPAPQKVEIDGATHYVRILTIAQSDAMRKQIDSDPRKEEPLFQRIATIAALWCDEDGKPLFNVDKPEDFASLSDIPTWFAAEIVSAGTNANDSGK